MAIKIVTGGTTGLQDGTLVDESNRIVFTGTDPVEVHMRCDDGYWSADQDFDLPAQIEVSFDGGSTWYGNDDEPITAPEIEDVNYPIKLRQPAAVSPGSTASSFDTDGTYTAISALSTPTLTATVISPTQIDLSWTNVANEDGYSIERSPNGSSGWSEIASKAAGVTTHSDTGLSSGTQYFYRVKAEGSGRYSDSGWGTDDATTDAEAFASDDFTGSNGSNVEGRSLDVGGTWVQHSTYSLGDTDIESNRARQVTTAGGTDLLYASASPPDADYSVECDVVTRGGGSDGATGVVGRVDTSALTFYAADYYDNPTAGSRQFRLYKLVAGAYTSLGTYTQNLGASATANVRLEMIGTAIKAYVDDVERISATDSSISAAGKAGIRIGNAGSPASNSVDLDNFSAIAA